MPFAQTITIKDFDNFKKVKELSDKGRFSAFVNWCLEQQNLVILFNEEQEIIMRKEKK